VRRATSHLGQWTLPLDGLTVADLRALMAQLGIRLTPRASHRLHQHTGGNPQLSRALADELDVEELTSSAGVLPAPRSFVEWVERRFDAAPGDVRAVVGAVAVSGQPVTLARIAALTAIEHPHAAIDQAMTRKLLRIVSRRGERLVDVEHALVRSSVNQGMPFTEYMDLNARAAQLTEDPLMRMFHRLHATAGYDEELVDDAVAFAEECAARGAMLASARVLEAAGRTMPTGARKHHVWTLAAERLLVIGELPWAERLLDEISEDGSGEPTAHELLVAGHRALQQRRADEAAENAGRAWAIGGDAAVVVGAAEILGYLAMDRGDGEETIRWAERALEAADRDTGIVRWAGTILVSGWAFRGDIAPAKQVLERHRSRLTGTGSEPDIVLSLALASLWTADWRGAERYLDELRPLHDQGSVVLRSTLRLVRAVLGFRTGAWDDVIDMMESELSLIDEGWESRTAPMTLTIGASVLAARGETVRARNLIDRAEALVEPEVNMPARIMIKLAKARTALATADHPAVVATLAPLRDIASAVPEGVHTWRADLAEALVALGRHDEAEDCLDGAPEESNPYSRAGLLRARSAVALARDDVDLAERWLREAVGHGPVSAGAFPHARAQAALGALLRRRGLRRQAADHLAPALETFRGLGAHAHAETTQDELHACALRRGEAVLTPAEERVARIAVTGSTNREIAQTLNVSVKTVETHMGRIFMKLGLRHRVELVTALETLHD
ncbi:MAG: hypothetical protein GX596_12900, partial [Propionibacterium sp.]|nr:hypothetical protein [Propionibacterium sp.]